MAEGLENFTEEQKAAMTKELEAKLNAEFESKLNSVRTEEKNKLYPEIAKLKADLEKKATQESELMKKITELESKASAPTPSVPAMESGLPDADKLCYRHYISVDFRDPYIQKLVP